VELRGAGDQDGIAGGDDGLVAIEAERAGVGRGDKLVGERLLEVGPFGLHAALEDVRQAGEFHVFSQAERLGASTGTASAAPDHADLDGVTAGSMGNAGHVECGQAG